MADNACKKRRGKKDRIMAELTTAKNRRRRIAKDDKDKAGHAAKFNKVNALRRLGAVHRLERRIKEGAKGLEPTLAKAQSAHRDAAL